MAVTFHSYVSLVGRLLLSAIFLFAGAGKIMDYAGTAQQMADRGMPAVELLLPAAIAVEILGGLSLLLGFQTRLGALLLFLFLIPTTLIYHNFWAVPDPGQYHMQLIHFMKNLAIMGGLLEFCAAGAGAISIDALLERRDFSVPTGTPAHPTMP